MQLSSNDTFAVFTVKLISCKNYGAISVYETPCVTASSMSAFQKKKVLFHRILQIDKKSLDEVQVQFTIIENVIFFSFL